MNYVRITLINIESREETDIGDFITEKHRTEAIDAAINTIWKDSISAVLDTDDFDKPSDVEELDNICSINGYEVDTLFYQIDEI